MEEDEHDEYYDEADEVESVETTLNNEYVWEHTPALYKWPPLTTREVPWSNRQDTEEELDDTTLCFDDMSDHLEWFKGGWHQDIR